MESQYNLRSPAVKRLMKEAKELREPTEQYFAQPLEDNLFEWHFTVRGPPESDFDSGCYHGRIVLPPEYPMKPPSILLLTPNGRFEVGKKICLSISGHHPETWQPSWSIRTVLLAIIGFMPTKGGGAIGSLDYTPTERKILARKSQTWTCETCGCCNKDTLKEPSGEESVESKKAEQEAKDLAAQISFKEEMPKNVPNNNSPPNATWPGMGTGFPPPSYSGMMAMMSNPYNPYTMTQPVGVPTVSSTSEIEADTSTSSPGSSVRLSTDGVSDDSIRGLSPETRSAMNEGTSEEINPTEQFNSSNVRHRLTSAITGDTNAMQAVGNTQSVQGNSRTFTLYLMWIVASLLLILAFRRIYINII